MARYNEILVGRYNRWLQKLLQLKGDAPAPQLAGEIQPSILYPHGVESRYLEGWNLYGRSLSKTAQAAVTSAVRLRNPAGSNVLAVIEKVTFTEGTANTTFTHEIGATGADLDGGGNSGVALDTRGRPGSALVMSANSLVDAPSLSFVIEQTALLLFTTFQAIVTDVQEQPLLPGQAFQIRDTVVNQSMRCSYRWRERAIEESELT